MAAIARRVSDKRMLKLIRAFLESGVMENGLVSAVEEGTPQGGPLSPLLSNLVLDELDRELERRKHRFVRYADDCNIYVAQRAGGKARYAKRDGLPPAATQAQGERVEERGGATAGAQVSGLQLYRQDENRNGASRPRLCCAASRRVRELTRRTRGISLEQMMKELATYLRGWKSYFGFCQTPSVLRKLEEWMRRRLRSVIWKQWKRSKVRYARLRQRNIGHDLAAQTAGSPHGPWRLANSPGFAVRTSALLTSTRSVFLGCWTLL